MYFGSSYSYNAGVAGPMWPQEMSHHNWYQQDYSQDDNWNLWGHDEEKSWAQKSWGSPEKKAWNPVKAWNNGWSDKWDKAYGMEAPDVYGRQDDYREYNNFQEVQLLDNRLKHQAKQLSNLREEPEDVLVVNSVSSGAYSSLCADASKADLVAFDCEWLPDDAYGSDNPISVLQLAFPLSRRVYVLQLNRLDARLPKEVQMMMVNPEVRKVGFAVDLADRKKMSRSGIAVTAVTDVQEPCAVALGLTDKRKSLSLKNASFGLLGINLDKDKRLTCSNWSTKELSKEQIRYAALDAWVVLSLLHQLGSVGS